MSRFKFGPGLIITAAFIGPGTITACTIAGASFGFALLWTVLFSIIAGYLFQETSGRLGLISQKNLGELMNDSVSSVSGKRIIQALVILAIGVGNSVFQAGNLTGASLGISSVTNTPLTYWPIVLSIIAFALLFFASYKLLEKFFAVLIFIISLCFIVTVFMIKPDLLDVLKGFAIPKPDLNKIPIIVAIFGTTLVPYNLFLYSSIVKEKWKGKTALKDSKNDLLLSLALGGLITSSIIITAGVAYAGSNPEINSAGDMAYQLEPLLGSWAKIIISLGLFGAGVTSAITAPLAAAYAVSSVLGISKNSFGFKALWISVLLIGVVLSSLELKPIKLILSAQFINGLFLPIILILMLILANKKSLLGDSVNTKTQNIFSVLFIIIVVVSASYALYSLGVKF